MRRMVVVGALAVLMGGVAAPLRAADTSTALVPQATLEDIYKQLESIRRQQDDLKNVSRQLEQVLKNQQTIMTELEVVKIRASRR